MTPTALSARRLRARSGERRRAVAGSARRRRGRGDRRVSRALRGRAPRGVDGARRKSPTDVSFSAERATLARSGFGCRAPLEHRRRPKTTARGWGQTYLRLQSLASGRFRVRRACACARSECSATRSSPRSRAQKSGGEARGLQNLNSRVSGSRAVPCWRLGGRRGGFCAAHAGFAIRVCRGSVCTFRNLSVTHRVRYFRR